MIHREFWSGLLVAAVLTMLNVLVEHSALGSAVRVLTYQQVHRWLPKTRSDVVVIDLTPVAQPVNSYGDAATPAIVMQRTARALALAGVDAIGIDCVLERAPSVELTREYRDLFEELLAISSGKSGSDPVPVFFGVMKFPNDAAKGWFGENRFDKLAAHVKGGGRRDDGEQQLDVPTVHTWKARLDRSYQVDSLGVALVRAVRSMPPEATQLRHFWTENVEPDVDQNTSASILLDTTDVEDAVEARIRVGVPGGGSPDADACERAIDAAKKEGRLKGRIAIVGRADPDRPMDRPLHLPGRARDLPGTYLHVAAVQTLEKGYLKQVTALGTIVIDLALAIVLLSAIAAYKQWRLRRGMPTLRPLTLAIVMAAPCLAVALLGGPLLAVRFRIVWDGAAFVAIAIILHLLIEVVQHERHASSLPAPAHPA